MNKIIIDSGPLIALFDSGDRYHNDSIEFMKKNKKTLVSTIPVITEVIYILDFNINAQLDFLEWIYRGGIEIVDINKDDIFRIKELMKKYSDRPMDFADGSLVAVSEKTGTNFIASIDTDFDIYRLHNRKKFKNVFR